MRSKAFFIVYLAFFLVICRAAWGETIQGKVTGVNANQNTIEISRDTADVEEVPASLSVSHSTSYSGIDSLEDIEVGDTVQAEVSDAGGSQQVTHLAIQRNLDEHVGYTWGDKFGRGVVNFFTSPVEIARAIDRKSNVSGPAQGWTVGLVEGLGRMVYRAGAGLLETVTFPFGFPDEEKAPLLHPEYAWQEWETADTGLNNN